MEMPVISAERFLEIVKKKAVLDGEFILASGIKTNRYFDFKMVLTDPEGIFFVGKKMFELITRKEVKAVGGYGLGCGFIVAAVVLISILKGKPLYGFEVIEREKLAEDDPKKHEDEAQECVIKGYFPSVGGRVAIFDDVISTGGAILKAIKTVEDRGCQVIKVAALLDRQLGGSEKLQKRGYDFTTILIADALGKIAIS